MRSGRRELDAADGIDTTALDTTAAKTLDTSGVDIASTADVVGALECEGEHRCVSSRLSGDVETEKDTRGGITLFREAARPTWAEPGLARIPITDLSRDRIDEVLSGPSWADRVGSWRRVVIKSGPAPLAAHCSVVMARSSERVVPSAGAQLGGRSRPEVDPQPGRRA